MGLFLNNIEILFKNNPIFHMAGWNIKLGLVSTPCQMFADHYIKRYLQTKEQTNRQISPSSENKKAKLTVGSPGIFGSWVINFVTICMIPFDAMMSRPTSIKLVRLLDPRNLNISLFFCKKSKLKNTLFWLTSILTSKLFTDKISQTRFIK